MAQLGTFANEMVCHENSLVRIDPNANMKAAALISCGISTGFGSAVDRAKSSPVRPWSWSGAEASDRAPSKEPVSPARARSSRLTGALQAGEGEGGRRHPRCASLLDAQFMLPELTQGRNADVVILTPGVLKGDLIAAACAARV